MVGATGASPVLAVTPLLRRHVSPRKAWNEEGVASTVGTIMALLVFLTFLSLITNQYVPVWMKDSEAGHLGEALGQMGGFKSDIDLQILAAQTALIVGRHYVPVTTFSSVKLGVDGVPIFSSPTIGELTIDQASSPWTVWFRYSISGNQTTVPEANCACGGVVRLHVFNRFFPQQTIAYENGALIRAQFDGFVIKGDPSFQVLVSNTSAQVDFTLIQLFGSGGVAGVGPEGMQARVLSVDLQEYANIQTAIHLNTTTRYGPAWYRFFNDTLSKAYGVDGDDYKKNPDFKYNEKFRAGGLPDQLRAENPIFLIQTLWDGNKNVYTVTVQFRLDKPGDSITVVPISVFRLLHAYVNVAAGERGNQVGI